MFEAFSNGYQIKYQLLLVDGGQADPELKSQWISGMTDLGQISLCGLALVSSLMRWDS
jgi:hypothetical protein